MEQQLGAHYPQAQVCEVSPEEAPLHLGDGEQAWAMNLRLQGPEYLLLCTFRDDVLLEQSSDPLISIIGSLSGLEPGECLVARTKLSSLRHQWSSQHQEKADHRARTEPTPSAHTDEMRRQTRSEVHMAIVVTAVLVGVMGYLWVQKRGDLEGGSVGSGHGGSSGRGGLGLWRINKARQGGRYRDPLQIK